MYVCVDEAAAMMAWQNSHVADDELVGSGKTLHMVLCPVPEF